MSQAHPPMSSRKFLVVALSTAAWFVLIGMAIVHETSDFVAMCLVLTLGFVQVSYFFGQSYVDRYVQALFPRGHHATDE